MTLAKLFFLLLLSATAAAGSPEPFVHWMPLYERQWIPTNSTNTFTPIPNAEASSESADKQTPSDYAVGTLPTNATLYNTNGWTVWPATTNVYLMARITNGFKTNAVVVSEYLDVGPEVVESAQSKGQSLGELIQTVHELSISLGWFMVVNSGIIAILGWCALFRKQDTK